MDNGLQELAHALRVLVAVRKMLEHRDIHDTKIPDRVDPVHRDAGIHEEREEVVVNIGLAGTCRSARGQNRSSHDEEQVNVPGKLVEEDEGKAHPGQPVGANRGDDANSESKTHV